MTIDLDKLLENDKAADTDPRDWSKPSLAVIAYNDKTGIVLWHVGAHVESSIEQIGGHDIDELGFDGDPPTGISVWEGKLVGGGYNSAGEYDDVWLKGTYRAPTAEEWTAIREGRCPWNDEEWLRADYQCLDCGTLGPHHCGGVPGGFSEPSE